MMKIKPKRNRYLRISIIIMIVLIVYVTIAEAALNSNLKITGEASYIPYKEKYDYGYTGGGNQVFVTPTNGYYQIELWGAGTNESRGGYTRGVIYLNSRDEIYTYVGGQGGGVSTNTGGYNGGGNSNVLGTPGSGATDVRLVAGAWNNFESLKSRIMVAGGGAGRDVTDGTILRFYGSGGGISGYKGMGHNNVENNVTGGSQTSGGKSGSGTGGTFGIGASGTGTTKDYGSGGGGGYYGGGSSYVNGTGGGGSSYISGHTGCNSISSSSIVSNIVHTGSIYHYSGKYFTNTVMKSGNESAPRHCDYHSCVPVADNELVGNHGTGYANITLQSW